MPELEARKRFGKKFTEAFPGLIGFKGSLGAEGDKRTEDRPQGGRWTQRGWIISVMS